MFLKKLIKPIVEVCKKNCSCVCDEMIYRIADEGDLKMENRIKENSKKFINDFIFVCFLLGNDFVPNIVSLSLKTSSKKIDNGLDIILEKYSNVFRDINNYPTMPKFDYKDMQSMLDIINNTNTKNPKVYSKKS